MLKKPQIDSQKLSTKCRILCVKITMTTLVASLVASCTYRPIVDLKGLDEEKYKQDLSECTALADQAQDSTLSNTLIGAGLGAIFSGIVGGNSNATAAGAAIGGTGGLFKGQSDKGSERKEVLINCLYNRGYNVLNAGSGFYSKAKRIKEKN